jgi:hypothetical protein
LTSAAPSSGLPGAAWRSRPFLALLVLLLGPLWAAFHVNGPRTIVLDFGPGDGPYVSGFTPEWEVDEKVGTHWTTYQAEVALPVELRGPLRLTLRSARVLPQTAVVDVSWAGRPVDRFTCRGGVWEERTFTVADAPPGPARLSLRVDSHDRRNLGLKLDWLRVDAERVRLAGWARMRPLATVLLLALLLLALGIARVRTAMAAAPVALALTVLLLRDPWLAHRLLSGVPECLSLALALVVVLRVLPRFRPGFAPELRLAGALAAAAFLLRAGAVNHPSFYYPDLLVHARLVELVRDAGIDFLRAPSHYLWGDPGSVDAQGRGPSGLWLKEVGGQARGLPYSLAFHAPFAPFAASLDRRIAILKLAGAALSAVPILALGALARRWRFSPLGLYAMVLLPTALSRLSFGLLPALFGHAVEMLFVAWFARQEPGPSSSRTVVTGGLFLAACQLAYVSASASLLVAALAAWACLSGDAAGRGRARALAAMLLLASALSIALYYRDFLTPWLAGGGGPSGVKGAGSGSGLENPLLRLVAVFGLTFVAAAAAGALRLWRPPASRALVGAWALVGASLLLARSLVPVMRFSHEELWLAPLVCLAAGEALAWLWGRGGAGRALAVACACALACEGAWLQWQALAAQLGNAR